MNVTILGGHGFIGRHLSKYLDEIGYQCWIPERRDKDVFNKDLGIVFYCIGLTADFRQKPYDTVDAHVSVLNEILQKAEFEQLVYLSSTRVYTNCIETDETTNLTVAPNNPNDLYNISKLLGENLVLTSSRNCSVARLSNVLGMEMGNDNFVGEIIAEARAKGSVNFRTSLSSSKDYIWIDDVVAGLAALIGSKTWSTYNIASGTNITNGEIAEILIENGVSVTVLEDAPVVSFPVIEIEKLSVDTHWKPRPKLVINKLRHMIQHYINN